MKLIFIDEQYGSGPRGKFTAIIAAVFPEEIISEYRREFVKGLARILGNGESIVRELPVLHGVGLLKDSDCSDQTKIAVITLQCELVRKFDIQIDRLGYYDNSLKPLGITDIPHRLGFIITNFEMALKNYFSENYALFYELDRQNLGRTPYNDKYNADIYGQVDNPDVKMSIDFGRSLGRFYCHKENYCMYAADVIGWLLYQVGKDELTEFKRNATKPLQSISDSIIRNEIVWMRGEFEKA